MEQIELSIVELYELRALLDGFAIIKPAKEGEEPKREAIYPGFISEKGITEGTKRQIRKASKVLNEELKTIEEQRQEIRNYKEEGLSEEELKAKILAKDQEVLNDKVKFMVEKLDFQRIEDLTLSMDYGLLYEKLFK